MKACSEDQVSLTELRNREVKFNNGEYRLQGRSEHCQLRDIETGKDNCHNKPGDLSSISRMLHPFIRQM